MTVKEEIHLLVESLNEAEAVEALHLLQVVIATNGDKVQIEEEPTKLAATDKPLWGIAGIGSSAEPTNVAKLKDEYLAEAFESERS